MPAKRRWFVVKVSGFCARLNTSVSREHRLLGTSPADAIAGFRLIYPDMAGLTNELVTVTPLKQECYDGKRNY